MASSANPSLRLGPHSRIAVVGGGPAGSFFALNALQIAARINLPLDITIFERKDFSEAGPRGCNMCAGILSHRVMKGLAALELALPAATIMGQLRAYELHWGRATIPIQPSDPERRLPSVFRAGGPRKSPFAPVVGFDAFLLDQAETRGVRILLERVEQITLQPSPLVQTSRRRESFDLVVLCTGVNAAPPVPPEIGYVQPATETMAQDALLIKNDSEGAWKTGTVHVYFEQPKGLIFGALIPKGPFATVSLLGRKLGRDSIAEFLAIPEIQSVTGTAAPRLCGCWPKVAVSLARGFYADRFVAVGDSCVSRLYKDGIGSAWQTARSAAETALGHGISSADFAVHYAPICRAIDRDNRYGRAVFSLVEYSKRNRFFAPAMIRALEAEADEPPDRRVLRRILWLLFTGDSNYQEIFRMMFRRRNIARIAAAMIRSIVQPRT